MLTTAQILGIVVVIVVIAGGVYYVMKSMPTPTPTPTLGSRLERIEDRESSSIGEAYVDLELETFNGAVTVVVWQGDKVTIGVVKVGYEGQLQHIQIDFGERVDSEALGQVRKVWIKAEYDRILGFPSSPSVYLNVKVPEQKNYSLTVRTSNGPVQVEDLEGRSLLIDTSNGGVTLEDVLFPEIQAETSNGGIEGSLQGDDVEIDTSNGEIDVRLLGPGTYDLSTSNGGIKVETEIELPVRVDASTSNGKVTWSGPALTIQESSETRLRGETGDFDPGVESIDLKASTSNGGIDLIFP